MASLEAQELELYAASMEVIKARLAQAQEHLKPRPLTIPTVEAAALQVRLSLETLVLSTLHPNRSAVEQVSAAFHRADHVQARKIVRRVNSQYWPHPTRQRMVRPGEWAWDELDIPYLREEHYAETWGRLSAWLHARNPFTQELDPDRGREMIEEVVGLLIALLNHHTVTLAGSRDLVACLMEATEDGRVHVNLFTPASSDGE